jgi:large subunit ribosomal protein L24
MKIKTGDNVRIMKGKDAGKTGKVTQAFPKKGMLVVDGTNKAWKHLRRRGTQAGARVEFGAPIRMDNVRVVGKDSAGRVGYTFIEKDGKRQKVRAIHTKKGLEHLE